jgi:SAM-dependent methyltransferase
MAVTREEVLWCYRSILGREPESEKAVEAKLKTKDFAALREAFLSSSEFINKQKNLPPRRSFMPRDVEKNEIEYEATPTQLKECLTKIKAAWSHLGITRPHHSVLTNERYLPDNLPKNLDDFYASGEVEAKCVEKMLARHDFTGLEKKTCVEYGCGVGRVTMGLARLFDKVHAYDISPNHLALAEERAATVGVANCKFHLCSAEPLAPLEACDFFYSRIVFQHNPPPVIAQLIRNALRSLKTGGIAIFQVPTYHPGYRFSIKEWLATEHALDMQMHCLPQPAIFKIFADEYCVPLEVREDGSTGGAFISNTFIVRRAAARKGNLRGLHK